MVNHVTTYPKYLIVNAAGESVRRECASESAAVNLFTEEVSMIRRWGPTGQWRAVLRVDGPDQPGVLVCAATIE